jgi:hypothetical protein
MKPALQILIRRQSRSEFTRTTGSNIIRILLADSRSRPSQEANGAFLYGDGMGAQREFFAATNLARGV